MHNPLVVFFPTLLETAYLQVHRFCQCSEQESIFTVRHWFPPVYKVVLGSFWVRTPIEIIKFPHCIYRALTPWQFHNTVGPCWKWQKFWCMYLLVLHFIMISAVPLGYTNKGEECGKGLFVRSGGWTRMSPMVAAVGVGLVVGGAEGGNIMASRKTRNPLLLE